jgi:hypothetical protein
VPFPWDEECAVIEEHRLVVWASDYASAGDSVIADCAIALGRPVALSPMPSKVRRGALGGYQPVVTSAAVRGTGTTVVAGQSATTCRRDSPREDRVSDPS